MRREGRREELLFGNLPKLFGHTSTNHRFLTTDPLTEIFSLLSILNDILHTALKFEPYILQKGPPKRSSALSLGVTGGREEGS